MEDDRTVLMSARPLAPGHDILWYTINKVLGQGGFGITYLARDQNLHRDVAIKEYLPVSFAHRHRDFSVKPITGDHRDKYVWGLDSFLKEAQTLARFGHDNIVRVHSVFEENSTAYMVMAYEHGKSLASIYSDGSISDQTFFENTFFPIFDGLEAIHRLGFIHRDIKPANIYIRENQTPVLIDFGSARQTSQQQTGEMTTLVSQGYTPLEQYSANYGDQGPWTDIYALAATVYEGMIGERPDECLSRSACMLRRKPDTLLPPEKASSKGFDSGFVRAVYAGLALEPEARPQTLGEWQSMFNGEARSASLPTQGDTEYHPRQEPEIDQNEDRTRIRSRDMAWENHADGVPMDETGPQSATRTGTPSSRHEPDAFDFSMPDRESYRQEYSRPGNVSGGRKRSSRSPRVKSSRVVGLFGGMLAVTGLAAGILWWLYVPSNRTMLDADALAALPKPSRPISTVLPKERLLERLDEQARLAGLLARAHAIDGSDSEVQAGIERVYDDLIDISGAWSASRHDDVANRILGVADQLPDITEKRSMIRTALQSSTSDSDTDAVLAMLKAGRYVEPAGSSVLDRIASLDEEDLQQVQDTEQWLDMMSRFRESALSSLSSSDFERTARIVEAALAFDPSNADMIALRGHLSR